MATMADKKAEAQRLLKERTAKKRFKVPEGDTTFRVLPNAAGASKREWAEYAMHSEIGPRKAYMRCGKNSKGEGDCYICDKIIPKLEKSEKAAYKQMAERMARKDCFAVQIIYKDESDHWVGPVLWEMPGGVANSLLGLMGRRDISDPEEGYNLTISRTGTGKTDTRYGAIDKDDEKSEVPKGVMEKLKPFSEVVRKYEEAAMKAAYLGHEQEEEEEPVAEDEEELPVDEDEEEPKPKKPKKPVVEEEEEEVKPKKPKKPAVEEDEEEESVEEDDIPDLDEEEELPKPKKPKKPVDEDEEEPVEEEEEVKPKKPKKPVVEEEDEEEESPKPKKPKKPVVEDDDDL